MVIGRFTEVPDSAPQFFSSVRKSHIPGLSIVADQRTHVNLVLLKEKIANPVSVSDGKVFLIGLTMRCHNLLCSISLTEIVPFTNCKLANCSFHSNIDGRIFREKKVLVLHRVVCAVVKIVGFDMSLISSVVHIDSLIEVI